MPGYDRVENVRSLSQAQINKLNNAQLKEALGTLISVNNDEQPSNAVLLDEIRSLRDEVTQLRTVKHEVETLSVRLDDAYKIINNQQKFLETLDTYNRNKNLIIYGVCEEDNTMGVGDDVKVRAVLEAIDLTDMEPGDWEMMRLGQPNDQRKRPIRIALRNQNERDKILEKAKRLKDAGAIFTSVYIRKDLHPAVRKELARLREREKVEKNKAENAGANIVYDWKNRVLLRDGIVIDRYSPNFF